jgi:hypothetical protein
MGYETRMWLSELVFVRYLNMKLLIMQEKQRYGKMKCSHHNYVHKYQITDMVTCSVYREGPIVEQRKAGDVITHEEEVTEGE